MKLLTVTVPCYNSQEYMEKCIDSLLPGGDRVEIIIINDGSKDATGQIADRYAQQYPGIVKVIHQENGGHGEGINQGLKHATGQYFKVVDSDDCMSADFPAFLDLLERCCREQVDLVTTNYFYTHADGVGDRSINYSNVLPQDKTFTWDQIGGFRLHQLLTIHSSTFRTDLMRRLSTPLPKHTFYEDNLMVYQCLPGVEKMRYMNADLYLYTIGRPGQSVQEDITKRRYSHQLLVAERCFMACRLDEVKNRKLKKYLLHELYMMFAIGIFFARLNQTRETDQAVKQMWDNCRSFDKKWANHFRWRTTLFFLCMPGKLGQLFDLAVYRFANKIVRFN